MALISKKKHEPFDMNFNEPDATINCIRGRLMEINDELVDAEKTYKPTDMTLYWIRRELRAKRDALVRKLEAIRCPDDLMPEADK